MQTPAPLISTTEKLHFFAKKGLTPDLFVRKSPSAQRSSNGRSRWEVIGSHLKCYMRNHVSGLVLAGFLSAACVLSSSAQNLNLSFNTDTFTPNFTVDLNGTATTTNWLWGASAGPGSPAGGGVRVATQADLTAEYNPSTFQLSADTATISLEFKTTTSSGGSGDKPLQLGFLAGPGTSFNDSTGTPSTNYAFISFRIFGDGSVGFQTKTLTGGTVSTSITAAGAVTFTDWVKASLTLTAVDGTTGAYNYSVGVWDIGPTGTATPTILVNPATATGSVTVPSFASSASGLMAYAGWRSTVGNPNFADLSVTVVPEPSTLALAVLGFGLLILRRSRS